ncbi:protein LATERAL ROOT PRIMORDIUM 1-like [Phragmites australis]|uniref:protein LATERAL ROOT PRIMORDIUM 1-like n=1 Tax=Phragmites australis TaxID=29695 RepID=UPI002D781B30|nr:protein LATERAL ROOT PRIMORDIUM 1-like [Phragmites australis]
MVVGAPAASLHNQRSAAAAAADDPMFPLVAAAQRALDADAAAAKPAATGGAIQFWQAQPAAADGSSGKKPLAMLDYGRGGGSSGFGAATCHDCGNQAKKGCAHNRCRTCCNSRGFECDTHVRSTWVSAARRRERLQLAGGGASSPPHAAAATKKPRLLACPTTNSRTSTSNAITPRSYDTSSSHQDASFRDSLPRQVRGPAVFRCVSVTSVDDSSSAEVAYQAAVTINGHLFRGLLYDQGAEVDGRATNSAVAVQLGTSNLHLGSASTAASDLYGGGAGGPLILGGLCYGNTP